MSSTFLSWFSFSAGNQNGFGGSERGGRCIQNEKHDCLSWESGGSNFDWDSTDDDTYFSHLSRGDWF